MTKEEKLEAVKKFEKCMKIIVSKVAEAYAILNQDDLQHLQEGARVHWYREINASVNHRWSPLPMIDTLDLLQEIE